MEESESSEEYHPGDDAIERDPSESNVNYEEQLPALDPNVEDLENYEPGDGAPQLTEDERAEFQRDLTERLRNWEGNDPRRRVWLDEIQSLLIELQASQQQQLQQANIAMEDQLQNPDGMIMNAGGAPHGNGDDGDGGPPDDGGGASDGGNSGRDRGPPVGAEALELQRLDQVFNAHKRLLSRIPRTLNKPWWLITRWPHWQGPNETRDCAICGCTMICTGCRLYRLDEFCPKMSFRLAQLRIAGIAIPIHIPGLDVR